MAYRLRLLVKKRGSRRTGARWTGLLAEILLFAALTAIGIYGLYWLFAKVLLAEGARYAWWAWLAILIPLALVGYGVTELAMLVWQNIASSERRAAVVQMATEWELGQTPTNRRTPRQGRLPAVPSIETVTDSPGVRLTYRLPIDAASGWVSFTMAAVCIAWNSLVAFFAYRVIQQHLEGRPNWLLTWLLVPFVLAGGWTLFALARQVLFDIVVGTTLVEVSHHPFYPGHTYQGFVSQSGRLRVRWFQVQLVCVEQAVYQQGTDTRRAVACVHQENVFSQRKFDILPQQAFEATFDFTVPDTAMHSFLSPHNAILWLLVVRARIARWGELERRFPVFVYPPGDAPRPATTELAATARNEP
jgi:hypothetical protein